MLELFAGFIAPCLPTKAPEPPSGSHWLHEIKHDGFRVVARKHGDRVRLGTIALGLPDGRRVRLTTMRLRRSASPGALSRGCPPHGFLRQEGPANQSDHPREAV